MIAAQPGRPAFVKTFHSAMIMITAKIRPEPNPRPGPKTDGELSLFMKRECPFRQRQPGRVTLASAGPDSRQAGVRFPPCRPSSRPEVTIEVTDLNRPAVPGPSLAGRRR